jgi:lysozyme
MSASKERGPRRLDGRVGSIITRGHHSGRPARNLSEIEARPVVRRAPRGRVFWKLSWAARFIAKWEGYLPYPYLDTIASPPVWTAGYGHTKYAGPPAVLPGQRWSEGKSLRVLTRDIRGAARVVKRNIRVKLTVRQRIALISLVFNCGSGAVDGSELQKKLNRGDYLGAANEFLEWCHAGGVVVEGLLNRRREERWIFLHSKRRGKR